MAAAAIHTFRVRTIAIIRHRLPMATAYRAARTQVAGFVLGEAFASNDLARVLGA